MKYGLVPLVLLAVGSAYAQQPFAWRLGDTTVYAMTAIGSPMTAAGATLTLRSTFDATGRSANVSGSVAADTLTKRIVQVSADFDTRDVTGSTSVWVRADSGGKSIVLDNGTDQGIKGTTSGVRHMDVTIYVPAVADRIVFGLLLQGGGEVTARNVRITARPAAAA